MCDPPGSGELEERVGRVAAYQDFHLRTRSVSNRQSYVKSRLIRNYGYCDVCATDVLSFVASIFARGHAKK